MRVTGTEWVVGPDGRAVYLLGVEMAQRYRHAVGSSSPFYEGLERGVLRSTRCRECGASWFPPRRFCEAHLTETDWYDLPGTGTVTAATRVHSPPPFGGIDPPYILASIRLDGVTGGITHRVMGAETPEHGAAVVVKFIDEAPAHPLLAFAFTVEGVTP
ncbi:MAG: OB-fold domain-containing protein [bacterium]|nr:OB-fold domain-containing protein [bacterium]MDE0600528.1 OB-fold domain-containing protein [bacterium]